MSHKYRRSAYRPYDKGPFTDNDEVGGWDNEECFVKWADQWGMSTRSLNVLVTYKLATYRKAMCLDGRRAIRFLKGWGERAASELEFLQKQEAP